MTMEHDEDQDLTVEERRLKDTRLDVDNTDAVPLIPNFDKRASLAVAYIAVEKLDMPGAGKKGKVPPNTDTDGIFQLFGNGLYNFSACNEAGKVLRRSSNIRVAYPTPPTLQAPQPVREAPDHTMRLLDHQAANHEKDSARLEGFGRMVAETIRAAAQEQLEAARRSAEQAAQRDREFFAGMLAMFSQSHQMQMEAMRTTHAQQMQWVEVSHARERDLNNPAMLFGIFERGMRLAADNQAAGDDPITAAMKYGVEGLKEIGGMYKAAKLTSGAAKKKPASPTKIPNPTHPGATPQQGKAPKPEKETLFTDEEKKLLIRLKKELDAKSIDAEFMLTQALRQVEAMPDLGAGPDDEDAETPEESGESEGESDESSPGSDVDE